MRKGKRGQKVIPSASRGALNPKDRLRQQAYGLRNVRNFAQAKPLLEELYKLEPDNIPLALDLGEAYMETEDFASATSLYAKLIEKDPKNINAVTNLGGSLIRQGKLNDARSILEYALQLDPKSIHARINLGSVLQASGERKANLDNALEAVQIDPSSSLAFNNLGSAFSDMAMFKEAKHAYETAVMLDSQQVDALINLAAVEARLGDSKASAEMYERVLKLLPKEAEQRAEAVKFYAAFEYLKQGVLEKGWDYYEGGFSPLVPAKGARTPRRNFDVPRWDGEPLNGKTLLVWREQGLGDELLFYTCLHELKEIGGNIIVECDKRLVDVMARSFPEFIIRAEIFLPQQESRSPYSDFDFHLPAGSLMRHFRPTLESFNRSGAYIKPDPTKVAKFQERLAPYKDAHRLVGICWRSGQLDPVRNLSYTTLDEWGEVLQSLGFKFVNLQYGHCEPELQEAEEKYGVEILRWPDLDLRNDLDDIFALMTCLDAVVSVQTAVLTMGGCVGVPCLGLKAGGWVYLGEKSRLRWLPWSEVVKDVKQVPKRIDELLAAVIYSGIKPHSQDTNARSFWSNYKEKLEPDQIKYLMNISLDKNFDKSTGFRYFIFLNELLRLVPISSWDELVQKVHTFIDLYCTKNNISDPVKLGMCYSVAENASSKKPSQADIIFLREFRKLNPSLCSLDSPRIARSYFLGGLIEQSSELALESIKSSSNHALFDNHIITILAATGFAEDACILVEKLAYEGFGQRELVTQLAEGLRLTNKYFDASSVLDCISHHDSKSAHLSIACAARWSDKNALEERVNRLYLEGPVNLTGLYATAVYWGMDRFKIDDLFDWCRHDVVKERANVLTDRCMSIIKKLTKSEVFSVDNTVDFNQINMVNHKMAEVETLGLAIMQGEAECIDSLASLYPVDSTGFSDVYQPLANLNRMGLEEVVKGIEVMYQSSMNHRNAFTFLSKALKNLGRSEKPMLELIYQKDSDKKRYLDIGFFNIINHD